MKITRVVVATPSMIDQSRLEKSLGAAGNYEISAQTHDLSATYARVEELMPDIVIVSEFFFQQDEYSCMVSLFRAVEARVFTLVPSPSDATKALSDPFALHARMSPQVLDKVLQSVPAEPSVQPQHSAPAPIFAKPTLGGFDPKKVILIGASTGGIDALTTILQHFPVDCPPTAIVQHTGQNFSETLARLLNKRCAAEVVLAKSGLEMKTGRVCLAGGIDGHLRLESGPPLMCRVERGALTSGHIPSIDELFFSGLPNAHNTVAALLTGMGRDGAVGLLRLLQAGAVTIGQDMETSVVYGMPRVAFEMGAVQQQLPLPAIGPTLLASCSIGAATRRHIEA